MACCCSGGSAALAGVGPPSFAAPAGTLYSSSSTGLLYQNVSGTATGWYVVNLPGDMRLTAGWHEPRVNNSVVPIMFGVGLPNGLIQTLSAPFPGAFGAGADMPFISVYTNSAVNDNAMIRSSAFGSGTFFPTAQDTTPEHAWDVTHYIRTTARPRFASAITTMTNIRIWCAVLVQSTTEIQRINYVPSDTLRTYFQTGLPLNNNLWAAALRFSTSAGDTSWQLVTTNNNGAVYTQSIVSTGVPVPADTNLILRLRYRPTPVPTVIATINHGPEFLATVNVGPGGVNANLPLLSCHLVVETTLALTQKSIGWAKTYTALGKAAFV